MKQNVPVESESVLDIVEGGLGSKSLMEWWGKEYASGNRGFDEGKTYTLNRYSFEILSTEELDAIASSTFHHDDAGALVESFKY